MTYFEECIYKFNNLPQQNQDAFGSIAVLQKINTLENKYKINLGFMAILIAIGELEPTDIAEYIEKKYKLKKVKAEKISSDFDAQVINPAIKNTIGTPQGFSLTTLTLQEEKELIIKFFKEEFVDILKGSPDRQNAINLRIFYVLSKDGN
ncbi:hypothetical protein ISS03_04180, partial [Patescibacteria group bacterium]|nr:hypothetical protein [Patescibacteria group bacterium]